MTPEKPPGWLVDLSLVGVCLIWGATFILVKRALADISTLLFLTLRFTAATVVLVVIFRKQFRSPNLRMTLRAGLLAGLCLFSGYVLQTFGLKYTSASKTGFSSVSRNSAWVATCSAKVFLEARGWREHAAISGPSL